MKFLLFLLSFLRLVSAFQRPSSRYPVYRRGLGLPATHLSAKAKVGADKVRVRLLENVKDTGKKGEIVFVSAALWSNVLLPKKVAQRVTDEELASLDEKEAARQAEELAIAQRAEAELARVQVIVFKRKVGQNRQLFGAVTGKQILESVKQMLPNISAKTVIESIKAEEEEGDKGGDALVNNEIRKSGRYKVKISLHPKVNAVFFVDVLSET